MYVITICDDINAKTTKIISPLCFYRIWYSNACICINNSIATKQLNSTNKKNYKIINNGQKHQHQGSCLETSRT